MKKHIVLKTNDQLRQNINKQVNFENTKNCMRFLNDENKLQVNEKNKNWKNWMILKNLKHFCYKLTASG